MILELRQCLTGNAFDEICPLSGAQVPSRVNQSQIGEGSCQSNSSPYTLSTLVVS